MRQLHHGDTVQRTELRDVESVAVQPYAIGGAQCLATSEITASDVDWYRHQRVGVE